MATQRVSNTRVAALVVGLFVTRAGAQEVSEVPVAEPVPAAVPVVDDGGIHVPESGPSRIVVPAAEPVPVAEPISEDDRASESEPAVEMIVVPDEPILGGDAIYDTRMVPVAEPVAGGENAPVAPPISVPEVVPAGDLESSFDMTPIGEPGAGLEAILSKELDSSADSSPYTEEVLELGPPWVEDESREDRMTLREMFLQSHREQLEIYDLNRDSQISEEEWKAANEGDLARGEKFFVVDKNEDGAIDETEAVGFLMERVSLSSTYLDATSEKSADITRGDIKEHAPSELRVTLFSIPLGD